MPPPPHMVMRIRTYMTWFNCIVDSSRYATDPTIRSSTCTARNASFCATKYAASRRTGPDKNEKRNRAWPDFENCSQSSARMQVLPINKVTFLFIFSSLEVRKIPVHENTIQKLNDHFSKFGQITNIQVLINAHETRTHWFTRSPLGIPRTRSSNLHLPRWLTKRISRPSPCSIIVSCACSSTDRRHRKSRKAISASESRENGQTRTILKRVTQLMKVISERSKERSRMSLSKEWVEQNYR